MLHFGEVFKTDGKKASFFFLTDTKLVWIKPNRRGSADRKEFIQLTGIDCCIKCNEHRIRMETANISPDGGLVAH